MPTYKVPSKFSLYPHTKNTWTLLSGETLKPVLMLYYFGRYITRSFFGSASEFMLLFTESVSLPKRAVLEFNALLVDHPQNCPLSWVHF